MWIITSNMTFSLYMEDIVEQTEKEIRIGRSGSQDTFVLTFDSTDKAQAGWKKLQEAIRKNYQNVSIYECRAVHSSTYTRKGRLFQG